MASFVTNQYRGRLSTLHGATLTVALMDPTYVGGADDTDLSSVSGEVDVLDAPGYVRQTVTGVWDAVDGVLRWDDPPSFDAAGADEIQTVLIADDQGDIVAGLVWSTPVAGVDGMIPEVEHVAAVADEAGVVARIAALEQDPGGGGPTEITGLLSTGEPAGLIPVTDGSGGVTLEPVPSGGGGGDGASISWRHFPEPQSGELATWAIDTDAPTGATPPTVPLRLVRFAEPAYIGPIVGQDPGLHPLGAVHPDHAPMDSQILIPCQWVSQYTLTGGPALMAIMSDGSVMVMDLTGTLGDSDEVILSLGSAGWLTLMGGH